MFGQARSCVKGARAPEYPFSPLLTPHTQALKNKTQEIQMTKLWRFSQWTITNVAGEMKNFSLKVKQHSSDDVTPYCHLFGQVLFLN